MHGSNGECGEHTSDSFPIGKLLAVASPVSRLSLAVHAELKQTAVV